MRATPGGGADLIPPLGRGLRLKLTLMASSSWPPLPRFSAPRCPEILHRMPFVGFASPNAL